MRNNFYYLLLIILLACNKENMDVVQPPAADSRTFYLQIPRSVQVETQTRSVTDTDIQDVYLFVFSGDRYVEHIKASEVTAQGTEVKVIAGLPQYSSDCHIYVLANVEAAVAEVTAGWTPLVTTLEDVKKTLLSFPELATADGVIKEMPVVSPFISSPILVPSGKSNEFGKTETISVTRTTAKISVELAAEVSNFTVTGLTLANVPKQCFIFPEAASLTGAPAIDRSQNYGANDGSGTFSFETPIVAADEEIYLYESSAGTYNAANGTYTGTSLIIKAQYASPKHPNGTAETGYYRIIITDSDKNILSLLRNNHYIVTINKVDTYGYATAAEAMNHPSANIDFEVRVTDDWSHDIVSTGDTYLGLTNSEYVYYGDLPATNLLVTQLIHNAKSTTPIGKATAVAGNAVGPLLALKNDPFEGYIYNGNPTDPKPITIDLPEGFTEGKIHLRIGTLEKEILVRRKEGIKFEVGNVNVDFAAPEYVYAETIPSPDQNWAWLSLSSTYVDSNEGHTSLESHNGNIRIHYLPANSIKAPHRMEFYFSRRNYNGTPTVGPQKEGRVKVSFGLKNVPLVNTTAKAIEPYDNNDFTFNFLNSGGYPFKIELVELDGDGNQTAVLYADSGESIEVNRTVTLAAMSITTGTDAEQTVMLRMFYDGHWHEGIYTFMRVYKR